MNAINQSVIVSDNNICAPVLNKTQAKRKMTSLSNKISKQEFELDQLRNALSFLRSEFPEPAEKAKGRPKKASAKGPKKAQEDPTDDLFAKMVSDNINKTSSILSPINECDNGNGEINDDEYVDLVLVPVAVTPELPVKQKKHTLSKEEKEAKKLELEEAKKVALEEKKHQLEQEKELKKLQLEQEKELKKLALEQAKEAKKQELEAAKEAKKHQLEQEKELKRLQLEAKKLALEQEKEAKKLALEAKKAPKAPKEVKEKAPKKEKATKKETEVTVEKTEIQTEPVKLTVTWAIVGNIKYLKSTAGVLYNPETKEAIGIHDEESNTIKPLPEEEDDEEMEEDGYDSN